MNGYATVEHAGGETLARDPSAVATVAILDDGLTDISPVLLKIQVAETYVHLLLDVQSAKNLAQDMTALANGAIEDFKQRGGVAPRFRA